MKRRTFVKTTAAGSALLMTPGAFAIPSNISNDRKFAYQSERKIPIAYNVDVVVVGGSTAGVAAAVEAARSGAKVFLLAQEPYLADDVCGTFRLWTKDKHVLRTELGQAIWGEGLPSQLKVKKVLDQALISNHVDFLYSCFATDILIDNSGNPAGVVMANRSGRQAIVAKTIIDATPRGLVARMAGAKFDTYPTGSQQFKFTVVGNKVKEAPNLSARVHDTPVQLSYKSSGKPDDGSFTEADTQYKAIEYSIQMDMKDDTWGSFAGAEQLARDLTWDADQVESSDLLFQNPPDKLVGQEKWDGKKVDPEEMSIKVFQPLNTGNLFVLSGSASLGEAAAEALLEPGGMIRIGERIGSEAASIAKALEEPQYLNIKGDPHSGVETGDVGEFLNGLRSSLNTGDVISEETAIPVLGTYDVVVLGGGTAGAPASVGAAQNGAKTLVIDYMHGLGGMGTQGMIGRYFHGYRKGYTNIVDKGVKDMGPDNPRKKGDLGEWVFDWKTEYFRKEIRRAGGEIWFGVIGCGAFVENNQVKGVVVATPNGRGVVLANSIIDSTGSADVAIVAGASYNYTDGKSVAVQGAGFPFKNPDDFYNNTDWTFIDDTDMLDVWRAMVVAKDKFDRQYDIGKIPQTRERRRMVGDFTISVLDIYNHRTYPDSISLHKSSFDTHGFTEDPFFSLKPPEHGGIDVYAYVPFRALLPKGLEGIAVTGLGASAHRDAMPVIRMQPCLQNQGYAVGRAAAMAARKRINIRDIDIKALQRELVKIGSLPETVLTDSDNYPPTNEEIREAVGSVVHDLEGLGVILWDQGRGIKALKSAFHETDNEEYRLTYGRILGMLGEEDGWEELIEAIDSYEDWDEGWNFTGMGQFGRSISYLDSLIIAAGRTKRAEALPSIFRLMAKLTPESHFSHFRAVALALEAINDERAAEPLYSLIEMPGVRGHAMPDIQTARELEPKFKNDVSTRNNSLREIILARALYKCGDYDDQGYQILEEYSKDLRGHYYRHASGILDSNTYLPQRKND